MQIAIKSSLVETICKILNPITKIIFPQIKEGSKIHKEISMNIIANMLGLGNAATPLGLKAMKSMQEENINKDKLSNEMAMFIIINTASIQIIPTTVLAIRNSLNSTDSTQIILPVWIVTICAAISAIVAGKVILKINQ
ncbi:MAG: nucleoside recognition protein [Clostridia bacterium]|nr:nucleoside recognition protein [Clostridia bacterium]